MRTTALLAVIVTVVIAPVVRARQATAVPMARFAGTWVGTQAWAIPDPPPGSRQDQPVTLTVEIRDGRITGTMKPFLGGEDGATFVDAKVVGEELQVSAVVGRPRGAARGTGGRAAGAGGNATTPATPAQPRANFVFTNDGLTLKGRAEVFMGDVPWTRFTYELSKKRSRY